jgi:hypothetical protein
LGKLNLELALLRARSTGEDIEDKAGAIDDLSIERFFKVFGLARREFIVEDHDVHALEKHFFAQFFDFTLSDKSRRIVPFAPLYDFVDDAGAGRCGQFAQFIEVMSAD